jgi:hypothetical protein
MGSKAAIYSLELHILELWKLRNLEVHGDTPEKTETIHRTTMITEIIQIQNSLTFVPHYDRDLISRDEISLKKCLQPLYQRTYMAQEC